MIKIRLRAAPALAAGLALVAGALVAGGVAAASSSAASSSVASAAAPATSAPSAAPRSAVPWRRVGSGWQLALWATRYDAAQRLYLIDPAGRRYLIAGLPKEVGLTAWSGDGRRVLTSDGSRYRQLDLVDGRSTPVPLPRDARPMSYTRPHGLALLAEVDHTAHDGSITGRLERFGLDGRHQQSYPITIKGAGRLGTDSVLETPDGAELIDGAEHGVVLLRNNGTLVRRLGASLGLCDVTSMWTRSAVTVRCNETMWAVPLSGAHPTRLTEPTSKDSPLGNDDIWRYSLGRLGLAAAGCGPDPLVTFDEAGRSTYVDVVRPKGRSGRPLYSGHHGDVVDLTVSTSLGCQSGATTLFGFNAATHRSTVYLGAPVTTGTVTEALPFSTDR